MNILMILTSHDRLGNTAQKTGYWLEEFAAPYYVFKDAHATVTLASPAGGQPPLDPKSDSVDAQTDATRRFKADPAAQAALAATHPLSRMMAADFDAVFYPGGHGPLWDLAEDAQSIALIEDMLAAGKPVVAVCHAPGVLRHVKSTSGAPLVAGRAMTGYANSEERAVGLTDVVPFLVEDMLAAQGGRYSKSGDWQSHVVRDGDLITGQNPASSGPAALVLLERLRDTLGELPAQPPSPVEQPADPMQRGANASAQPESQRAIPRDGGDLEAARRHRASVETFVASGQVEDAAREAEPQTHVDEVEMFEAERSGEAHSKGEDPAPDQVPPRVP